MATAAERAESREMEEKLSYPWEKHFSEEHGMFYYFNVLNGESSWQKPTEAEVDSSVEETQQQPVHGANYHEYRLEEDYFVEIREGLEGGDDTSDNWAQTEPESPQYYGAVNSEDQEHETDSVVSETLSYSTNKTSSTSMGVYERSAQMMMAKKEREEAMRLKLEQQKLQGIQSVPTINKKSKSLSRNVDDMLAWEQKRKQKLAMKQMELEALELESLTGKPMVTKTAERLARQWQEQDDGISDTTSVVSGVTGISAYTNRTHSVQDRLLYYDEQRKAKLQRLKEEQAVAIRAAANPKVAPHSANLQRPGDVADRLYNLAHQKQEENVYVSNVQHDEHGNRLFQVRLVVRLQLDI